MRQHKSYFKIIHWVMALGIISAFCIAFYFDDLPFSLMKMKLINYHKWIGFSVLLLVIPRLIISHFGYESLKEKSFNNFMAKSVHVLMYITMFSTPILGWLMSSAKGFPIVLFGFFPIPDLIDKNIELGKSLSIAHEISAYGLALLIVLHIAGAIKRQFIEKDPIIKQMI